MSKRRTKCSTYAWYSSRCYPLIQTSECNLSCVCAEQLIFLTKARKKEHLLSQQIIQSKPVFRKNYILNHLLFFYRCVTVHGTHGVNVINNVAYNTFGHCYFLEDGGERYKVILFPFNFRVCWHCRKVVKMLPLTTNLNTVSGRYWQHPRNLSAMLTHSL